MSGNIISQFHSAFISDRRIRILAQLLAREIPAGSAVLDVGAGDGRIAATVMRLRPDVVIEGIDVFRWPQTAIPVSTFDGTNLPFAADRFDTVIFVDVLHHSEQTGVLLREAARVARNSVIIKDHLVEGFLARPTLRIMDWIGNCGNDVALPYNYFTRAEWLGLFASCGFADSRWIPALGLYPFPFSLILDRKLHFMAHLPVKTITTAETAS